jgi:hypothetical protein
LSLLECSSVHRWRYRLVIARLVHGFLALVILREFLLMKLR